LILRLKYGTPHGNEYCLTHGVGVSVGKPRSASRVIKDALISMGAVAVLLVGLVAMDPRVREQASLSMDSSYATSEVAASTAQAHRMTETVVQAIKTQADTHGPLMMMLCVGVALGLIMFRT